MEFAVIENGGKQYKVAPGQTLSLEALPGEHKEGDTVTFDKVLLVNTEKGETTVGTPYVNGATVNAEYQGDGMGKKVSVMRFRAKSRYVKNRGHRQPYSTVRIKAIKA